MKNKAKFITLCFLISIPIMCQTYPLKQHNLVFNDIPQVWDEAIPLGNGITGALIWQKDNKLRIAIDRADLWDLRPVKEFETPDFTYKFICDQIINKKDIGPVHRFIDDRSDIDPAPTKIPAAAIEIDISKLGKVKNIELDLSSATCIINWENGAKATFFAHATDKLSRFQFENLSHEITPELVSPQYENSPDAELMVGMNPLSALGYKNGEVTSPGKNLVIYNQKAYGNVSYQVALEWNSAKPGTVEGTYCVTSKGTWYSEKENARELLVKSNKTDFNKSLASHCEWWTDYWNK